MIVRPRSVTFHYRVGSLTHVSTPEPDIDYQGSAFVDDMREFKTLEGALGYKKRLETDGSPTFIQYAVVQWLGYDEACEVMEKLAADGRPME